MIVGDNKLVGTNVKAVIDRKLDEYIAGKLFCDFDRNNPEHVKRLNLASIVDEILVTVQVDGKGEPSTCQALANSRAIE